jgi:hypothetical protein
MAEPLGYQQIGRSCGIGVSTVPDGWNDTHLEAALYPSLEVKPQPQKRNGFRDGPESLSR